MTTPSAAASFTSLPVSPDPALLLPRTLTSARGGAGPHLWLWAGFQCPRCDRNGFGWGVSWRFRWHPHRIGNRGAGLGADIVAARWASRSRRPMASSCRHGWAYIGSGALRRLMQVVARSGDRGALPGRVLLAQLLIRAGGGLGSGATLGWLTGLGCGWPAGPGWR